MVYSILNIIKTNVGYIFKKKNRKIINNYKKIFQFHQNKNTSTKEKILLEKLNEMINYCYEYVPYYTELFNKINFENKNGKIILEDFSDIKKIPILTKKIINKNLEKLKSLEFSKNALTKNSSGGSTGEKAVFYQHKEHRHCHNSTFQAFLRIYGVRSWQRKHLLIWGNQNDLGNDTLPNNIYTHLLFNDKVVLNANNLSKKELNKCCDILKKIKFNYIRGYSQGILVLANYINENKIKIKSQNLIVSTATQLTQKMKMKINKAFNCKIVDFYGSREVGAIGYYETENSMRIFENMNYVEINDNDNSGAGELLVTNLSNRGMPLLRYSIGDIGIKSSTRKKLPFYISMLKGRTADIFYTVDDKKIDGTFLTTLLNEFDEIKQFQIVQETIHLIIIYYIADKELNKNVVAKINIKFKKIFKDDCVISFVRKKRILASASGKFLYVISKVKSN